MPDVRFADPEGRLADIADSVRSTVLSIVKLQTSGKLRHIDLGPMLSCIPALFAEWADLRFDRSAWVLNPLTGEPLRNVVLVAGRHRSEGARYEVVTESPVYELPEHLRAEFDDERWRLQQQRCSPSEREDHLRRRQEASVLVGTETTTTFVTLTHDDGSRLAMHVTDANALWAVDVSMLRQPSILELHGRVDLTTLLIKEGDLPAWPAKFLGGVGTAQLRLDITALDGRGGCLVAVSGRANRFRGDGTVRLRSTQRNWRVDAHLTVGAKGLGRPLLWIFGRRLRRTFRTQIDAFWESAPRLVDRLEAELSKLSADTEAMGGPSGLVRQQLWNPTGTVRELRSDRPSTGPSPSL